MMMIMALLLSSFPTGFHPVQGAAAFVTTKQGPTRMRSCSAGKVRPDACFSSFLPSPCPCTSNSLPFSPPLLFLSSTGGDCSKDSISSNADAAVAAAAAIDRSDEKSLEESESRTSSSPLLSETEALADPQQLSFSGSTCKRDDNDDNAIFEDRHEIKNDSENNVRTTTATISIMRNDELDGVGRERTLGILVLLTVPLSWGTYAPVIKYTYGLDPPVPGLVFSAGYYVVASLCLLGLLVAFPPHDEDREVAVSSSSHEENQRQETQKEAKDTEKIIDDLDDNCRDIPMVVRGGLELGSYLFCGNCLQVLGLRTIPADRASFLVQLTTILVPVLQGLTAGSLAAVGGRTWIACILAFVGVIVMEFDGTEQTTAVDLVSTVTTTAQGLGMERNTIIPSLQDHVASFVTSTADLPHFLPALEVKMGMGDALVAISAVLYSFHVLRLEKYAKALPPLTLAAAKASAETMMGFCLIATLYHLGDQSLVEQTTSSSSSFLQILIDLASEVRIFLDALLNKENPIPSEVLLPAVAACVWTGVITCAYTIYAQSYGQRRVEPADANLIYTTQILFSAMFAFILLGETLSVFECVGGALIAFGVWVVSTTAVSSSRSSSTSSLSP